MNAQQKLFRVVGVVGFLVVAWSNAPAAAADSPEWQPMLAASFKVDVKELGVTSLVVYRHTGCVFLLVKDQGVFCSAAGANGFKPVDETWEQVCASNSKDSKHIFDLTKGGIKESTDSGATWSKPIPLPKDFVVTSETWLQYDAKHDTLYLMQAGGDLYKLARKLAT